MAEPRDAHIERLGEDVPPWERRRRVRAAAAAGVAAADLRSLWTHQDGSAPARRLRYALAGLLLAHRTGDAESRIEAERALAQTYLRLGHPRRTLARIVSLTRRLPPESPRFVPLTHAQALLGLGRLEEALAVIRDARARGPETYAGVSAASMDAVHAMVLADLGRCEEALAILQRASATLRAAGDEHRCYVTDTAVATVLVRLERFDEAEAVHVDLIERGYRVGDGVDGPPWPLLDRALMQLRRGRYAQALLDFEQARERSRQAAFALGEARADLGAAQVALHLNAPALAHDLAGRALETHERLGASESAAAARFLVAVAAAGMGRGREAMAQMRRAEEAFEAGQMHQWRSLCLRHLAQMHHESGLTDSAARLAREAIRVARANRQPVRAGHALLMLATIEADVGEPTAARGHAEEALEVARLQRAPGLEIPVLHLLGRLCAEAGDVAAAAGLALRAARRLERTRATVPPDELMASWLAGRSRLFQDAIRWVLARGGRSAGLRALRLAEQGKARALLDLLRRPRRPGRTATEREALALERDLRARAAALPAMSRADARQRPQATDLEERLAASLRRLKDEDPEAAERWHRPPLGPGSLARALGPTDALIEYQQLDDELLVFVLHDRRLSIERRPLARARLQDLLARTRFHLDRPALGAGHEWAHGPEMAAAAQGALEALGAALLGPTVVPAGARRLVVVPHRELNGLPFHALVDRGHALIEAHEVVQVPSLAVYLHCRARPRTAAGPALLIGLPDAVAPAIGAEINGLRGHLPDAQVALGPDATSERLDALGPGARFVHLACHARFRADDPGASGLGLADGWLTVREIAQLDLPTDLLVLAGCSTGRLNVTEGGDVFGLVSAFLEAGAANLLTSLWPVPDAPTAEFMARFHAELEAGRTPAAAQRAATLEVRRRHPHPHGWAGFVLVGAGDLPPAPGAQGPAAPEGAAGPGRAAGTRDA